MDDVLTLLRLQIEWGADEALDDAPFDRLRPVVAVPAVAPAPRVAPAPPPRAAPADSAVSLAAACQTLPALRAALEAFDGCALRDTASNLVFAEGDPASTTLIIGEPPGRDEDRGGRPFAGEDGALLDQMLASIGLERASLMLTPLLPWRPPGGRPPSALEVAVCLPFLFRLIVLLAPARLVLFGGAAARALLPPALVRRRPAPDWLDCAVPGLTHAVPTLCLPALTEMQKTPGLRRGAWAGLRRLARAVQAEKTET